VCGRLGVARIGVDIFGGVAAEGKHWMPDGCAATDERRRNEVIAVKCTLTALAFTKRPACAAPSRRALRAFGGNPLTGVRHEDDSREWDCSAAACVRAGRLIERRQRHLLPRAETLVCQARVVALSNAVEMKHK